MDQLPDIVAQKMKSTVIKRIMSALQIEIRLCIEYMWEYSPDMLKLDELRLKQTKQEEKIREYNEAIMKLESTLRQVKALAGNQDP